jgi:LCP family protein required for cell wall assembly
VTEPAEPTPTPRRVHPNPQAARRARHAAAGARTAPGPPRPGGGARRALVSVTRLLAVTLSVLVVVGTGYAWATNRSLDNGVTRLDALGLGGTAGSTAVNVDGADQNILIVGNDDRSGATPAELAELSTQQDGGSTNTDTMMVLHVPANGSKATIISLPRDSWVDIAGFGKGKLNSAYSDGASDGGGNAGGAKLLISTIEGLTGLSIDHYVAVSLLAFYRISNAIGGVPVCLNAAQNASTDSDAYGSGYSGIDLPAGQSVIQGKQALAFVRQRHGLPRGDLDRIVRQQYFLAHAFSEVASAGTLLNPAALSRLVTAVSSSLTVDTGLDLLRLATQVQDLSAGNITFVTIPTLGTPTISYRGERVSIVQVDFAAIPGFIAQVIGQPTAYETAGTVAPATVTVTVANGTTTSGLAGRNGKALTALGFALGGPTTVDAAPVTTIQYPAGMEAQAKTLAAAVPGAAVAVSSTVTGVTLVLGSDGVEVPGAAPTTTARAATTAPSTAPAATTTDATPPPQPDCIN